MPERFRFLKFRYIKLHNDDDDEDGNNNNILHSKTPETNPTWQLEDARQNPVFGWNLLKLKLQTAFLP